jgi:hypothetical protein
MSAVTTSQSIWQPEGFNAVVEKSLMRLRPAEMLQAMKRNGLRTRIGDVRIPLNSTLFGFGDWSPIDVLVKLRKQVSELPVAHNNYILWRRIWYFWQCQMVPFEARQRMADLFVFSILPGDGSTTFPKDTTFWDIEKLEFISLSMRLSRPVIKPNCDPFAVDHFDVRLNVCDVDRDYGGIYLGGSLINKNNEASSRCILSRMATFEPGCDPMALPLERSDVIDNLIMLHEHLENSLVMENIVEQSMPKLPQVWLGFEEKDIPEMEESPGLKARACASVVAWLRSASPLGNSVKQPEFAWADKISNVSRLTECDYTQLAWQDIASCLGDEDSKLVLADTYNHCQRRFDGLTVVPANFFNHNSPQKPWAKASRYLADIEAMLGRFSIDNEGQEQESPGYAKVQILRLAQREQLPVGVSGVWQYDFSAAEQGFEEAFK